MPRRLAGRPHLLVLTAVLAGAALLRLWHLDAWLPYHLLNPDEDTVLPIAFDLGRGHLNPDWFFYPSGFMYAAAGLWRALGLSFSPVDLAAHSDAYFLSARALAAGFGLGMVALAYPLAGGGWTGVAAAALVAVEGTSVAYSHMAVTDVPSAALATLALVLALAAIERRRPRLLLWAAVAAGAATSVKYSAAFALLPVAVAAWSCGVRRPRRLAAGAAAALAAFLALTPFALADAGTFASAVWRQAGISSGGWLGFEDAGNGWLYNLTGNLGPGLGAPALALAGGGLALAALGRRPRDLVLAAAVLPYFAYAGLWSAHFDRYLLPLVPPLAALAAGALGWVWSRGATARHPWLARAARPAAVALALAAVAVPAASSAGRTGELGGPDNRLAAMERVERQLAPGTPIALDPLGPPLLDPAEGAMRAAAGGRRPWYRLVRLPTPNPNPAEALPRPSLAHLRRLGVGWVLTSGGVRERVEAAAGAYPRERAFYRALDRLGPAWRADRPAAGPPIAAYRIG